MTAPDAGGSSENRQRLKAVRDNLVTLHKTLIESERIVYEQTFGKVESQNRFLQLLISDPWFAWLHPLSELVVVMDEALDDEKSPTTQQLNVLTKNVRTLLKASEEGQDFGRSYFEALQRAPDVILAHAEVMKTLAANSKR